MIYDGNVCNFCVDVNSNFDLNIIKIKDINTYKGNFTLNLDSNFYVNDFIGPAILMPNTKYYTRAYVMSTNGVVKYGNELSFTTKPIGQVGPSGGIVFFDKGYFSYGWQYLEAAPFDQTPCKWGCNGLLVKGTKLNVGSGEDNTKLIVSKCSELNTAAKVCYDLDLGGATDWFLPTNGEIQLLTRNLKLYNNLSGFSNSNGYWTSYEFDSDNAFSRCFGECFGTPTTNHDGKNYLNNIRAIRSY